MRAANKNQFRYVALIAVSIFLFSCSGGDSEDSQEEQNAKSIQLSGLVSQTNGTPIPEAEVSINGVSVRSDENGNYAFEQVEVEDKENITVEIEKDGFAEGRAIIGLDDSGKYSSNTKLLPETSQDVVDFSQASGDTLLSVNDGGSDVVKLTIPQAAVSSSTPTSVQVAYNDPTTVSGQESLPGESVGNTLGSLSNLEPVAAADITIEDYDGNKKETLGSAVTVDLKIPASVVAEYAAGDTIPWWSLNEDTGQWKREDAEPSTTVVDDAIVVDLAGTLYARGKVTHLSWWAAKKEVAKPTCLCVDVKDDQGIAISGVEVEFVGDSYKGRSGKRKTKKDGRACVTTKASDTTTHTGTLLVHRGNEKFTYDVTDPGEGDTGTDLINLPTTEVDLYAGANPSMCQLMANTIVLGKGMISGTVVDDAINPVAGLTLYSSEGESAVTNANGVYSMPATVDASVEVFAPDVESKTVLVTASTTLDFTLVNRAPIISEYAHDGMASILNGGTVNFFVIAKDPENQLLSYSWSTSDSATITPSAVNNALASLGIPSTGMGTTQVRVEVSDPRGLKVTRELNVSWGSALKGTTFKLTLMDNPTDTNPVVGATVALYNTDNKTVQSTRTSDSNGVVDFGDIGRSTMTFLVAYKGALQNYDDQYRINMFVDVPVASSSYFTDFARDLDTGFEEQVFTCPPGWKGYVAGAANVHVPFSFGASTGRSLIAGPKNGMYPISDTAIEFSASYSNMCAGHLQSDGLMSSLVQFNSNTPSDQSYGFILDQQFPGVVTWEMPLDYTFVTRGLTTEGNYTYSGKVLAYRKGVGHYVADYLWSDTSFRFPDQFPADNYLIYGKYGATNGYGRSTQRFGKRRYYSDVGEAGSMAVPPNSTTMQLLEYDNATNKVNWLKSSNSNNDISMISMIYLREIDGARAGEEYVTFYVWMDENAKSWTVPDLPSAISGWSDNVNLNNNFVSGYNSFSVVLDDYDLTSNFEQVWSSFIAGDDLNKSANDQTYYRDYLIGSLNSRNTVR
ncbi:MAG: carboxypeptidase-like regulatory domain-containing protein [Gammaproteobacteria bacterium]|nr:carboxypeptidase-like regulatory domain-containing protein [Gammaproteobacteria bacterium]MDH5693921.1 carboxypeptidase-like regulatory domain-containing protein [Gammaproteobacteria bacterium]